MAWAFDRVANVLGKGEDESQNANVFAPQQQPGQEGGSDRVQASSAEGSMAAGAGTGAQAQKPEGQETTPAARSKLFERNEGKVDSPTSLSAMGQQIKERGDSLQSEADKYVGGADDRFETFTDTDRDAIGVFTGRKAAPAAPQGAPQAQTTANGISWDSAYGNGPGQVQAFKPTTDTRVDNVDMLRTDAGLQELFRRQGGAEYNAGSAALDMALLRKNRKFNELRDQVLSQNDALQERARGIGDETTKKGQTALDTAYGTWKGNVTGELEGALTGYEGDARGLETAFDTSLQQAADADRAALSGFGSSTIESLKGQNAGLSPFIDQSLQTPTDLGQYYTASSMTPDKTNWQDFVTGDSAANWNKVLGTLGRGGTTVGPGQYVGADAAALGKGQFNSANYAQDILGRATQLQDAFNTEQKRLKDIAAKAEADRIAKLDAIKTAQVQAALKAEEERQIKAQAEFDAKVKPAIARSGTQAEATLKPHVSQPGTAVTNVAVGAQKAGAKAGGTVAKEAKKAGGKVAKAAKKLPGNFKKAVKAFGR